MPSILHRTMICTLLFVALCALCSGASESGKKKKLHCKLVDDKIHVRIEKSRFTKKSKQISLKNDHGSVNFDLLNGSLVVSGSNPNDDRIMAATKSQQRWSKIEFAYFNDGSVTITSWLNGTVTNNVRGKPLGPHTSIINYIFTNETQSGNISFSMSRSENPRASASIFCRVTTFENYGDIVVQLGNDTVYINGEMFIFRTPQYIVHCEEDDVGRDIFFQDKRIDISTIVMIENTFKLKLPLLSLDFDSKLNVAVRVYSRFYSWWPQHWSSYVKSFRLDQNGTWGIGNFGGSLLDVSLQRMQSKAFSSISCLAGRLPVLDKVALSLPRMLLLYKKSKPDVGFHLIDSPYQLWVNDTAIVLCITNKDVFLMKRRDNDCEKVEISVSYNMEVHALCWRHNSTLTQPVGFDPVSRETEEQGSIKSHLLQSLNEEAAYTSEVFLNIQYTRNDFHVKIGANEVSIANNRVNILDERFNLTESENELQYFDKQENRTLVIPLGMKGEESEIFDACFGENGMGLLYPSKISYMDYAQNRTAYKSLPSTRQPGVEVQNRRKDDQKEHSWSDTFELPIKFLLFPFRVQQKAFRKIRNFFSQS